MLVAFDTATPATVVGIAADDGRLLAERRHDPAPGERPGHTAHLLSLVAAALDEAGAGWTDVGRLGVGVGPGTFTGLRIGVASARALAQAMDVPVTGVSTLEALAFGALPAGGPVAAMLDARRGEAFVAAWAADGAQIMAPAAWPPERLAELPSVADGPWRAVGDGAVCFRTELEAAGVAVAADGDPEHLVQAAALCRLTAGGSIIDRDALVPEYVRAPDAVPRR